MIPDPKQFTTRELVRHADFYLNRDGVLPAEWVTELLRRIRASWTR